MCEWAVPTLSVVKQVAPKDATISVPPLSVEWEVLEKSSAATWKVDKQSLEVAEAASSLVKIQPNRRPE